MLENIVFFDQLNEKEIQKLEQISHFKKYKKDEFLFLEGEEPKWITILTKGMIKIYKTSPKGKEIFISNIRPVSFVAELANFENIKYPASAVFCSDGEVLKIDYEEFYKDFLQNPKICFELLKSIAGKLKVMNSVIKQEVTLDSDGKIALFISENFDSFCTLKNNQIAKILNLTPETLSRTLSKFKKENSLLTDNNGKIIQFDKEKLSKYYDF